jgi:hypothetical protein
MEHLCPQLGQVVDVDHDRVAGKIVALRKA